MLHNHVHTHPPKGIIMPPNGVIMPEYDFGRVANTGVRRGANAGVANMWGEVGVPYPADVGLDLDAKDESTISHASGEVSQWRDKSGNLRHANQATSASRPGYTSGQGYLRFDGSDDSMTISDAFMWDAVGCTVYVVLDFITIGNGDTLMAERGGGYHSIARMRGGNLPTPQTFIDGSTVINDVQLSDTDQATLGLYVYTQIDSGTEFTAYENGTFGGYTRSYSRAGTAAFNPSNITICSEGGRRELNADVYRILVYTAVHGSTERTEVLDYLYSYHGVTP